MKHSIQIPFVATMLALFLSACSALDDQPDILDAAAMYTANPDAFIDILLTYPRPFTEFTRIPARDAAKETAANTRFLKRLRKTMPVEYIDFFPRSAGGRDEINIMIKRYIAQDDWINVSLIYLSDPLSAPDAGENKALFDACDQRSVQWLNERGGPAPATAICKVSEHWYAAQRIG